MSSNKSKKTSTVTVSEDGKVVTGTIADLTKRNSPYQLLVNGVPATQPDLSVLTRLGFASAVGVVERPAGKRGPAAKIYSFPTSGTFAVATRR